MDISYFYNIYSHSNNGNSPYFPYSPYKPYNSYGFIPQFPGFPYELQAELAKQEQVSAARLSALQKGQAPIEDRGFPWGGSSIQWIGLWENQQETSILHGKNMEKPWFPVDFP